MRRTNVWMSVSDLMTGLMVIFLFIAIAYISKVQQNQTILRDFVENKQELHGKLSDEFEAEQKKGTVTISGDLSMRFERAETLFPQGSDQLTPGFKKSLAEIMPKYLDLLLANQKDSIKEIRIEGHTDDTPYPQLDKDPFMANLILSQRRALNVMYFIRSLPAYKAHSKKDRALLDRWLTASGLSYGRALDADGNDAMKTGQPINARKSRRVEIRIITSDDEVLENFVKAKDKTN